MWEKEKAEQTKGDWEWWREGLQLNRAVRSRWASVRSETRAKT